MRDTNIRRLYINPNPSDNIPMNIKPKPTTCLGSDINKVSNHDRITNLSNIVNKNVHQLMPLKQITHILLKV